MYADIIPFIRLPRSQSTFTYAVPESLRADIYEGSIVTIEFRKKRTLGCVFQLTGHTPSGYTPLPIHSLVPLLPLTKDYRAFLRDIAHDTRVSIASLMHDVIPIPPTRKRIKIEVHDAHETTHQIPRSLVPLLNDAQTLLAQRPHHTFLLNSAHREYVTALLIMRMRAAIRDRVQTLVLFPTHEHLDHIWRHLPPQIKEHSVVFHAQLAKNAYVDAWVRTREGCPVVLGTRSAIFAPGTWKEIIVVDEDDAAYKQEDQNPRYSVHRIIEEYTATKQTTIIYTSAAPRVTTWHVAHARQLPSPSLEQRIRLLDMRDTAHEHGFLHAETIAAIRDTLARGDRIAVFVARSGFAGSVSCKDCGILLVCTTCGRPLTARGNARKELWCTTCQRATALPDTCTRCHGAFFDFHGLGADRATHVLRDLFGDEAQKQISVSPSWKTDSRDGMHPSLTIVLSCEALLHHPDARSAERTYQWLRNIIAHTPHASRVIVQSWTPEHRVFHALVAGKPEIFYDTELAERAAFTYPPFCRSALLLGRMQEKNAGASISLLHHALMASAEKAGILVSEPYMRRGPRGVVHTSLYIRQPVGGDRAAFEHVLNGVPESWLIDREPEKIF